MMVQPASLSDAGIGEHFEELRQRVVRSLLVWIMASALVIPSADAFLSALVAPAGKLFFMSPSDAFSAYWSTVLLGGFFFSAPFWIYQFWAFVSSGLRPHERKQIVFFTIAGLLLFLSGAAFAFFLVAPQAYQFLLSYATGQIVPLITLDRYLSFVTSLVIAFGVAFQLPLVLTGLAWMGVASSGRLVSVRKFAVVGILIFAALLTPPDIFSQILLAVPLLVLFEVGVLAARAVEKRQ